MRASDYDAFAAAAKRAAAHIVKARARYYRRRPAALEVLYPGLAEASPATLVAVAAHLVEREEGEPRRWIGFGGEVGLVNAKAALLLGRTLRRYGEEDGVEQGRRSDRTRRSSLAFRPKEHT